MEENTKDQDKTSADYKVWIPLIFSIAALLGLVGGYKMAGNEALGNLVIELDGNENGNQGRVEELVRFIESRYVNELNSDELLSDAFENVLSHLDPHSIYLKPKEMKLLNEQMEGSFEGIGIESILLNDTLFVNHVLKGGPAEIAGMKIGDQIVEIGDSIISGRSLGFDEIRAMLKGERGTEVKLLVKGHSSQEFNEKVVVIGNVDVKSAEGFRLNEDLALISIKRFSADSYNEFMVCIEQIQEEGGFKNLIIDLRGNPGGFLPQATNILNQIFKDKGKLLVYTKGRSDRVSEFKTTGKNFYDIQKVAVLVDEGSASGSEIIAGAIQDWDRGLVLGRRTFGKGLVQEQYELSNGGALRLTVAKYFTPSGRLIQKSYENKDSYRDDIASRIESGEISGNLSMPVLDSTIYRTKVEKRIVYGGGGISPDIYIPADSFELSMENVIAQQEVASFVFKKFMEDEIQVPEDASTFVSSWDCPNDYVTDFKGVLGFTSSDFVWIDKYIKRHVKTEIAKLYYGSRVALEVKMLDDGLVTETISALSKKNIFAELSVQDN